MSCDACRNEFHWRNLLLDHQNPHLFVSTQWKWPPVAYIIYRVVVALYFVISVTVLAIFDTRDLGSLRWLLYLSNWTYLFLAFSTVVIAINAIRYYVLSRTQTAEDDKGSSPDAITITDSFPVDTESDEGLGMTCCLQAQWFIYNIATAGSLIVSIGYWSLLSLLPRDEFKAYVDVESVLKHAVNGLYVLADLFIVATPVRILHVWHPVFYGLVYLAFAFLFQGLGGTGPTGHHYIYPPFDFLLMPERSAAIVTVGLLVVLPIIWLIIFGFVSLRVYLSSQCCTCGRDYTGTADEQVQNGQPTS